MQFFISPKIEYSPGIPLKDAEVSQIMNLKAKYGLYIVIHGKYILNFARPNTNETAWQRQALLIDLIQANRSGANVIIHQGHNMAELKYDNKQALATFVENIKQILDAS